MGNNKYDIVVSQVYVLFHLVRMQTLGLSNLRGKAFDVWYICYN